MGCELMKNALMIAYIFPPLAGSAVQRTLKFVKYLPDFGWLPTVLTIKPYAPWPAVDVTLLEEVPPDVDVVRSYAFEFRRLRLALDRRISQAPTRSSDDSANLSEVAVRVVRDSLVKLGLAVRRWLFVPDQHIGWLPFALASACSIMRRKRIEVIYSSFPPATSLLIGYMLKKRHKIPWVIDFRDPWTRHPSWSVAYSTRFHRKIIRTMERTFVHSADKIITVSPDMEAQFYVDYAKIPKYKIITITSGFDEQDFQSLACTPLPGRGFTVLYAGVTEDLDICSLLKAWKVLMQRNPEETRDWQLRFAGQGSARIEGLARGLGITSVECMGYLPHRDTIGELLQAGVVLVSVSCDQSYAYTGKAFECLRTRKPILGLCPSGGILARLIKESGAGIVVPPDDVEAIARALWQIYLSSSTGENLYRAEDQFLAKYEWRGLTASLAQVFDEVTGE